MAKGLVNMEIQGAEDLEKSLRELGSDKEVRKTMQKALIMAGEPMAKAARQRARRRTGNMAESVDVSVTLSRRQKKDHKRPGPAEAEVFIGAKPVGPAVLIEFGTHQRHWKNGKSTGAVPASPFMRPAFEENKFAALDLFGRVLWVQIEASAKRIARRQAKLLGSKS